MAIVLFAILGANANVGPAYWICFGVFCMTKVLKFISALFDVANK